MAIYNNRGTVDAAPNLNLAPVGLPQQISVPENEAAAAALSIPADATGVVFQAPIDTYWSASSPASSSTPFVLPARQILSFSTLESASAFRFRSSVIGLPVQAYVQFTKAIAGSSPSAGSSGNTGDTQRPVAQVSTFSPVTSAQADYSFTIVFSDNVNIAYSTINPAKVVVSGPSFTKMATLQGTSPSANAKTVSALFSVAHSFSPSDAGNYSITVQENAVLDVSGQTNVETVVGSFQVSIASEPSIDNTRPQIQSAAIADVTEETLSHDFAFLVTDSNPLDLNSIGGGDISITGPNGFSKTASSVTATGSNGNRSATVSARVAGPFGSTEAGTYTVTVAGDAIADEVGNRNLRTVVGTFTVNVAGPTEPPVGDITVDFEAVTALPSGWSNGGGSGTVGANGLTVDNLGSPSWENAVESPAIVPSNGLILEAEFRSSYQFGAAGFISASGTWGDWSNTPAPMGFVVESANGSPPNSALHDGQNKIVENLASAAPPGYNKLRLEFGVSTVRVIFTTESSPGVFSKELYNEVQPIPEDMYAGVKFMSSAFSGDMVIRSVSSAGGKQAAPNGVIYQRSVPTSFFGYNGSALDIDDYNTLDIAAFGRVIELIGSVIIRWPGGDESNFWNQSGLYQNTEETVPLADWHFHGLALPIWLAYQTGEQTATRANLKAVYDAANARELYYVINGTTSTPPQEVAKLRDLIGLGFNLATIALGNETFFGLPYYTGDGDVNSPKYLRGHTSPTAWCRDMLDNFVSAITAEFGNTYPIYAPAIPTNFLTGSRENEWSTAILDTGLYAALKATGGGIDVHPYYNINDIGLVKSDVGNATRAGEIAKRAYRSMQGVLRSKSLAIFGDDVKIIYTEFNVLEDQTQTGSVILGQSWLHAIIQCQNISLMLRDPRAVSCLVHSMLGNAQWSGLVGEDGTNIDAAKRGIDDNPFTAGISDPLSQTLSGFLMGIYQRRVLRRGGTGQLIADEDGFMAWRITNPGQGYDAIAVMNGTNDSQTLPVPADSNWDVDTWTNNHWLTVKQVSEVPAPTATKTIGGRSLTVPPASFMVLDNDGSVPAGGTAVPDESAEAGPVATLVATRHPQANNGSAPEGGTDVPDESAKEGPVPTLVATRHPQAVDGPTATLIATRHPSEE